MVRQTQTRARQMPAMVVPAAIGGLVAVVTLEHLLADPEPTAGAAVAVAVLLVSAIPLAVGTVWLSRQEFDATEAKRVAGWVLGGAVPVTALTATVVFYQQTHGVTLAHPLLVTAWVGGVGAIGGFLTGVYDVQRGRRARRHVEASKRLRALIEASPVAIVAIDSDGVVTDWSQAATDTFGWERAAVVGEEYPLVPDENRAEFEAHVEHVNSGGTLQGVETERKRADGSTVDVRIWSAPIERDGTVDEHIIALVDVTERKENRQELKLLSRAIEQADDAVIITDDAGTIEYVNDAFVELFGHERADAVGKTPRILKSGEHDDRFYADLWETVTDGEVFQAEVTNRTANGELVDVELTIAPVEDDGEVTHYVAIERAVGQRKRDKQQLAVLNRFLRHNVRNAVTVIDGNTQQLSDVVPAGSEVALDAIARRTDELESAAAKARTVQQALTVDRTRPVNVRDVVESHRRDLREEHGHVSVTVDVPEDLWVQANDTLDVALEEALHNAVEHGRGTGVSIRVVATRAAEGRADICIIDDGPGVPAHERHVLEAGEESDLRHGSGIGLWMMKWVVTNLGGDISIAERTRGGTVVTFTLPRAVRPAEVPPPSAAD